MYKCKYFKIQELVPPEIYQSRGNKAWQLMDVRLLKLIDNLREEFGTATINNWSWGGDRQWSGLRTKDSPYYSPTSQHTFGRAADILFKVSAENVRQAIMESPELFLVDGIESITLENNVSWVHVDVRNNDYGVNLFNP